MENDKIKEPDNTCFEGEIKLPKNIRQIGETDKYNKIYMEDYVVTHLRQLAATAEMGSRAVALFGTVKSDHKNTYFFVYGAVCTERKRLEEGKALFEEEDKQYIQEKKNLFFKDKDLIGWALLENEFNRISEDGVWENGKEEFLAENKLFLHSDIVNQTEIWKIYNSGIEREIPGYAIFYDKNESMQGYLVEWHRYRNEYSMENVRDGAARKFRTRVTEKQESIYQNRNMSFFYIASTVLMIVLCVTGISSINHYQKMKEMETALSHLVQAMEEASQTERVEGAAGDEAVSVEVQSEEIAKEEPESAETPGGEAVSMEVQSTEAAKEEPESVEISNEEVANSDVQNVEAIAQGGYIVQEGDTLTKISRKFYQTSGKVPEICALNSIENPDTIKSGQKILLPQ